MNSVVKRVAVCLVLAANASLAAAQEASDASPPPTEAVDTIPVQPLDSEPAESKLTESPDSVHLEDVVVTATKRPQKLRDIPQSITALDGDDLERRGVQNLQDIVKLVPGVNLTNDANAPRITIRGISQSINTSPTAGQIFGNVSFSDAYLPVTTLDVNPFDLETVEVLKGPQGTLFGSSNLNGAIRYVPKAPELDAWQTRYYGQYTQIEGAWAPSYGAVVNLPLFGRDDLALRVMGFKRTQPGYVNTPKLGLTDTNEVDQQGVRGILSFQPGDWDIGLTYAYQANDSKNIPGTDNTEGRLEDQDELRLSPQTQAYDLADVSVGYDFGWAKLTSESSMVNKSANLFLEGTQSVYGGSPVPLASQTAIESADTYCEELRLSSPDEASADWHWLVGALAWKEIMDIDAAINIDPLAALPIPLPVPIDQLPGGLFSSQGVYLARARSNVSAREHALFGEVTRRWDRLEVTLGGRFYRTLSGGSNVVTGLAVFTQPSPDPNHPAQVTIADQIPEHGFNPKGSVSFHFTDHLMTYATVSRGYRVGGVQYGVAVLPQPNSPVPSVFKSDTIWNYEAGIRTEWFQRALRFDLTGYQERWKDPQYYTIDSSGTSKYLTNVGGVKSTGAEAALQLITPWGILFTTTAAYAKTITTKPFVAPNGTTAEPGSPWPFSPKWQTASTISYLAALGDWSLRSGVTFTYLGQGITDLSDKLPVFGYRQLDAMLGIENSGVSWLPEIDISLNNALNERGIVGKNYNETTRQLFSTAYIQPRTLNLRLVGHF
jgi:iron complex outermembrane receptor protein